MIDFFLNHVVPGFFVTLFIFFLLWMVLSMIANEFHDDGKPPY